MVENFENMVNFSSKVGNTGVGIFGVTVFYSKYTKQIT